MSKRHATAPSDVFINVPFDPQREKLFLALLAGLASVCIRAASSKCRRPEIGSVVCMTSSGAARFRFTTFPEYSFRRPRFEFRDSTWPFELGLAAAIALQEDATHQWRVLERVRYRLQQSLSDSGYDHSIHAGTIEGTMDVLLDIFGSSNRLLLSEVDDLLWIYRRVREFRATIRGDIYRPNAFRSLVVAARAFAIERATQTQE